MRFTRLPLAAFLLALLGVASYPAAQIAPTFPAAQWERVASPESVGFSRAKLESVAVQAKQMATTSYVAVVNGRILADYGDTTHLFYVASVRKSVLAMLFGNYVASGKVRLDKTLKDLKLSDHGGLSDQELAATIGDLLAARSGVYHEASYSGDDLAHAPPRGSQKHGTYFLYSNWDFNALGTIFEQETGRGIYDALEADLARPVAMQDFQPDLQKKDGDLTKSVHPAYPMVFSTRDMARIGHLMLREGNWAGRQLVPRDWAKRITSVVTPVAQMNPHARRTQPFGYGYLWWIWDGDYARGPYEGAYSAMGAGGQFITVVPKLDLVVAHKTNFREAKRTVSRDEYLALLNGIVGAYCGRSCS